MISTVYPGHFSRSLVLPLGSWDEGGIMLTLMTETAVRHTMDSEARAGKRAVEATALRLSFEAGRRFCVALHACRYWHAAPGQMSRTGTGMGEKNNPHDLRAVPAPRYRRSCL